MKRTTVSERALVLAPRGRDATIATAMLGQAGVRAEACASLPMLLSELDKGAAVVVVTEEALATADLAPLASWIGEQEEWSDLPFVLLTRHGGGVERNPAARRHLDILGNVTFVERPFHPTTLISAVRSALRGRRRQYEARARLEALREGERRYRTLFDTIDEGFCVIEFVDGPGGPLSDYIHIEANPAYERHAGIPGVVGKRLREIVSRSEADSWAEIYRNVLITGEPVRFERELVETGRYLELAAFRVEPAERREVAVLFQDVTPRRRAEAQLRELNETLEGRVAEALAERRLLADVIDGTDIFVQVVDHNYSWLAINDAAASEFARIFGVPRPKAGDNMLDMLEQQPGHQMAVKAIWARALAGEEFVEVGEFGDPDLDRRCYEMRFRTLRDADGAALGAYQFVSDVTDRLREQERLAEAEDALRQSQKMEAVGQLTGGVAHDFNNLLTIIKSSTELLRRPGIAEERRARYVEAISETVDRASKLTGQLLAFARRQSLKPEVFNVADRIAAVTEMLGTIVGSRIRIETDVSEEPCFVEADASQFDTALVNMAVNARDAMDGEGTLRVQVHRATRTRANGNDGPRSGDFVCIGLSDTGSGIPADRIPQIFEPFFTTKEVGKGTGLGLSQVFGFAKQSGGDISVESEVGAGSTFTLYLPRVEARADERLPGDGPALSEVPVVVGNPRVLIVEDNAEVARSSTQLLQDLGFETTWVQDGDEALRRIGDGNAFDIVFSDVIMPGMSGVELGHEIRRRFPGLPVVLTSGYSHVLAEEGRHGFELLHKPYAADQLARVLSRLARAPHDHASRAAHGVAGSKRDSRG